MSWKFTKEHKHIGQNFRAKNYQFSLIIIFSQD